MLFDIYNNEVDYIPHQRDFDRWVGRLSDEEFQAIVDKLNSLIDQDEIHTSSWIPGNDWTGTLYEPIYTTACDEDIEQSGLCFGLIVWFVFLNREDEWYFGRFEKDGIPIRGLTYFRKRT